MVKGVALSEVRSPRRVSAWDLFLVLNALRQEPFEPLVSSSFRFLMLKTVFLVSLASGRRCSEVHGLSGLPSDVAFEPDGSVSLRFLPEFLAKNQVPGEPSPVIFIKPLSSILCPDDEDRLLCPVRALRLYRRRSKPLRAVSQRRLFISLNPDYNRDVSKVTLARWLTGVIQKAYEKVGGCDELSARAHEIRA